MDWTGRQVLVTGAAGFIGSHLTEALVRAGADVRAFVRYTSGGSWGWLDASEVREDIQVFAGDIRDPETLAEPMRGTEVVFHLAALIAIPYSYVTPLAYVRTNVEGTTNVLEAARAAGVGRVVHTSTSEVYGTAQTVPISESHPLVGQSPVLGVEDRRRQDRRELPRRLRAAGRDPAAVQHVRAAAVGTGGDPDDHHPAARRAHGRARGADAHARPHLRVRHRRRLRRSPARRTRRSGQTINLGVGQEISIGDLAARIHALMDKPHEISHDAQRDRPPASEVERLLSDNSPRAGAAGLGAAPHARRGPPGHDRVARRAPRSLPAGHVHDLTAPAIPLFDLRMEDEDLEAVAAVLRSGRLRAGEQVEAFEREFAQHLGVRHAVAVSSGTAALHLAYLAGGIGPGDEVIVPSITFAASAAAVIYCGGTPVFADVCGPHDLGLDPDDAAARITPRTKAICAVHYGGYPAAVERLRELGPALIEDAAHSPDAERGARKAGAWGLASCFSFFSNKVLAVGEGGLLATDDDDVAARARRERSGAYNLRIDEPRAALLRSRMARMAADIAARRELTTRYRELLREIDGVIVPYTDAEVAHSSCYVMPIVLADPEQPGAGARCAAREAGIQTSLLYPAVHEFTAYRERYAASLPQAERIARSQVTLPLYGFMTHAQQDRVVEALAAAL